ncbi:CotH kinase family protein [Mangrovibacterium lignilyticum]|uniref:CotH kinase family protein n=1 Tax=Mangrovibacterium lignilyticum TaxID=2668052 RepID=UPI0013D39261|nr:CotH kinase family protein [Mangrovibacterium lignilyticum]
MILNTDLRVKTMFLPVIFFISTLLFPGCSNDEPAEDYNGEEVASEAIYQVAQLNISTENAVAITSKDDYVNCIISINSENEDWSYSGTGRVRGRGNSTWLWYPKKPYRIKLDDKAEILGLAADKDWVLLADYRDPTHLMNTFVFTVGQGLGLPYTNHSRYVEVILNEDYVGLYMLTEQVEEGSNRVAIDEVEGLLLSLDADDGPELAPEETDNFWSSVYHMPVRVKVPDIIDESHLASIQAEFAKLEAAIKSADYTTVEQLMDISSFINFMIIQELVYNVEVAAPRSINLYRDKGGKWTMGPLWDFDAGFDFDWATMYTGHDYFYSYRELVLGTNPVNHTGGYIVPAFFTDLFKSERFVDEYKANWLVVKDQIMAEYWETTQTFANGFAEAMGRDAIRWPIGKNNETETQRMQQWLTNRVNYLTNVIDNYPAGTK